MSGELERFRACVIADSKLLHRLPVIDDSEGFAATTAEYAVSLGVTLTSDDVRAALTPAPLGLDRFDNRPATAERWSDRDWFPGAVTSGGNMLAVDWTHFGVQRLVEPFFEDSLREAPRRPINMLLRRRALLSNLAARERNEPADAPDGLIFHMSRCGSTLATQMLASVEEQVVISEAPPLDAVVHIIHSRAEVPRGERVRPLRAMVAALGRNHCVGRWRRQHSATPRRPACSSAGTRRVNRRKPGSRCAPPPAPFWTISISRSRRSPFPTALPLET